MARHQYATQPPNIRTMPPGIPFIIGNEAAERFSFYGMRSILIVFMTHYLVTRTGAPDLMDEPEARQNFALFVSAVYFLPILGAILAEGFLGKYRTILSLSVVYCFGHFALSLDDTRMGLLLGLGLISLGSGGIKPCVSAHVGDQFGESNKHLLSSAFGWFYFSINAGAFISTIACPILLADPRFGPRWAFGLPGRGDGDRYDLLLVWTASFRPHPAGWDWIRKAILRQRGSQRLGPFGGDLRIHSSILVTLGPELRWLVDAPGTAPRSPVDGNDPAPCSGADGKPHHDPAVHPTGELCPVPRD
jgi:POT family proton-dependent oligopeptide transporter